MGHTLVACFKEPDIAPMVRSLSRMKESNKIPFGRDCNREEANRILPYHMTLFHWNSLADDVYLPKTKKIYYAPCEVSVTGVHVMPAEEGSYLLYFSVAPGRGFETIITELEQIMGMCSSFFRHITISVSKNKEEIDRMKSALEQSLKYPFTVHIRGFELYHIWKPCKRVALWE